MILATPTGSGEFLVALGAPFAALAVRRAGKGGRTYYTAPLNSLVGEKFFARIEVFSTANVGMMTGDSAVNADVYLVVMDEFHFYADAQCGLGTAGAAAGVAGSAIYA